MLNCEKCGANHDGSMGSGRFCSKKCARSFSTAAKREDITARVRKKMRARCRSDEILAEKLKRAEERLAKQQVWETMSNAARYRRVREEQEGKCLTCGISEWQDKPIVLELDHIDGNRGNETRENLRYLCPNCHSQTPTFRVRNATRKDGLVSDEKLIAALHSEPNISQALKKVGLVSKGGNYARAKKLLELKPGGSCEFESHRPYKGRLT